MYYFNSVSHLLESVPQDVGCVIHLVPPIIHTNANSTISHGGGMITLSAVLLSFSCSFVVFSANNRSG